VISHLSSQILMFFPQFKNDYKYADNFSPRVELSSLECSITPILVVKSDPALFRKGRVIGVPLCAHCVNNKNKATFTCLFLL
jgi:hypothetical protein